MRQGVLLTVASALVVSFGAVGVKTTESSIGQLIVMKSFIVLVVSLTIVRTAGHNPFPKDGDGPLGWSQYVSISVVEYLASTAVRMMPLADEALLSYTSIAFTIFLARVFLGEKCDAFKVISTLAILTGLLMTTGRPVGGYPNYAMGCIMALSAAFLDACTCVSMKKFTHHYSVYLLKVSYFGIFIFLPTYFTETWSLSVETVWISLIQAAHEFLFLIALSTEQLGLVTLIHASDIAFCYILELIFFDEMYTMMRILGSLLILTAAALTSLMEYDESIQATKDNNVAIV